MQFYYVENSGINSLKVEEDNVNMDNIQIACMTNLPFVNKNEDF